MTSDDSGHVNNLDETQSEALKTCWMNLTEIISREASVSVDKIVGTGEGDALFSAIGYDNPDILILRWLRARKWNVDAAVQQLVHTLRWRYDWGVETLLTKGENELTLEEVTMGKTYFMGYDKEDRPVNYIHIKDHIKDQYSNESTEKLGIFSIETGRKLLKGSVETGTVVIDMNGFVMHNMDYQLVKFFIHLLENHYPESLGIVLVIHAPLLFQSSWMIIKHWIDPVVHNKIHFLKHNDELIKYIHPSNLPQRLHGLHPNFEYIPPTDKDKAIIEAFRSDTEGKQKARKAHRKAARDYLNVTLKWAKGDQSESVIKGRKEATNKLHIAFEQLVPYISTRTHYHRVGILNEPIFDIAYEKLQQKNELHVVEF